MERGNDWSVRVANGVGKRVAWYRKQVHMTAVMLSARCAELGLPLDRNVIAKLENGYRNTVTVDEVYVLAAALGVSPVDLLVGEGAEEIEILPGKPVSAFRIARWFNGEGLLSGTDDGDAPTIVDEFAYDTLLPIMTMVPSGGWHVRWFHNDGSWTSEPLAGWGLLSDGKTILPLATDYNGLVLRLIPEKTSSKWALHHPEQVLFQPPDFT